MEIPTEKIIEQLKSIIVADPAHGQVTAKSVLIPLDAIEVIEKQAKEILELQAVVVRLRDEASNPKDFRLNIVWSLVDIKSRQPQWSDERCEEFLGDVAGTIEDMSIESGWEVIDSLICQEDDYEVVNE